MLRPMLWHCLPPGNAPCGFRMYGYTALYHLDDTDADPYHVSGPIPTPNRILHYSPIVSEHNLNMTGNFLRFLLSNTSLLYGCTVLYVSSLLYGCTPVCLYITVWVYTTVCLYITVWIIRWSPEIIRYHQRGFRGLQRTSEDFRGYHPHSHTRLFWLLMWTSWLLVKRTKGSQY